MLTTGRSSRTSEGTGTTRQTYVGGARRSGQVENWERRPPWQVLGQRSSVKKKTPRFMEQVDIPYERDSIPELGGDQDEHTEEKGRGSRPNRRRA